VGMRLAERFERTDGVETWQGVRYEITRADAASSAGARPAPRS
jgi:hypothetical protein